VPDGNAKKVYREVEMEKDKGEQTPQAVASL
jgi:hypothetical protein